MALHYNYFVYLASKQIKVGKSVEKSAICYGANPAQLDRWRRSAWLDMAIDFSH